MDVPSIALFAAFAVIVPLLLIRSERRPKSTSVSLSPPTPTPVSEPTAWTPMRRFALSAGVVLLVAALVGLYLDQRSKNRFAAREGEQVVFPIRSSGVSKADYDAIREGMSYADVKAIVGSPGEELASSRFDGGGHIPTIATKMFMWQNSDGSNMQAIFQDDRLVSKGQFGLR